MTRFVLAIIFLLSPVPAIAAGLIEEPIKIPATFQGFFGTYTATLDALVIRPDDNQRHPLAIINHGNPINYIARKYMTPRGDRAQAREFARRGWVAVAFTRRGFGTSEGSFAENGGVGCSTAVYEPAGRAAAEDIREVIRLMTAKPYADGAKIISVGASVGGFATVALTADPPPGLVAAISFAGGKGAAGGNFVCNENALVGAFANFGKTSRLPMLWVYAENDRSFGPDLAQRLHTVFTAAGGKAEFFVAPAFEDDGHTLFSRAGVPIWSKYVDTFLEEQNLKLQDGPLARSFHCPKRQVIETESKSADFGVCL